MSRADVLASNDKKVQDHVLLGEATDAEIVAGDTESEHWVSVRRYLAAAARKANVDSPTFTGTPKVPTPTQFDKSEKAASTKFVGDSLGSYRGLEVITSGAITLTKANIGYMMVLSGNGSITATLPLANSVPAGASISFFVDHVVTAPDTVRAAGTDIINFGLNAFLPSITLNNGDFLTLVSTGTGTWAATNRSVRLDQSSDFRLLKSVNGFRSLPGGDVACWGTSSATTDRVNVTFPEQFSAIPFVVPYDSIGAGGSVMTIWQVSDVSTTGFVAVNMGSLVRGSTAFNPPTNSQCRWRAWGWLNK